MSLKQRLLAFVAILLIAVVAALAGIAYWKMRAEIVDGVSKEVSAAVRGNREALARWMAHRRDAIEGAASQLSTAADPVPFLLAGKLAGRFDQTFAGYADKQMIYNLVDKKPSEGYDPTARPWYKGAGEAKATVVTAPYISASTKKLGITVASPFDANGQLAVVGGDISLDEIIELIKAIELRGGYAFLATRDGKIVPMQRPSRL